jgi:hypothetical protein
MTTVKRTVLMFALLSLAWFATPILPMAPADALVHGTCAGLGQAHLSSPFGSPVGTTPNTFSSVHSANFTFHFTTAANCLLIHTPTPSSVSVTGGLSASGVVHGWCGLVVGNGITSFGNSFYMLGVGGVLVFTGGVSGVVAAVPNVIAGDSCLDHTADDFILTGAVALHSCTVTTSVHFSDSIWLPPHNHLSVHFSFCP